MYLKSQHSHHNRNHLTHTILHNCKVIILFFPKNLFVLVVGLDTIELHERIHCLDELCRKWKLLSDQ